MPRMKSIILKLNSFYFNRNYFNSFINEFLFKIYYKYIESIKMYGIMINKMLE